MFLYWTNKAYGGSVIIIDFTASEGSSGNIREIFECDILKLPYPGETYEIRSMKKNGSDIFMFVGHSLDKANLINKIQSLFGSIKNYFDKKVSYLISDNNL